MSTLSYCSLLPIPILYTQCWTQCPYYIYNTDHTNQASHFRNPALETDQLPSLINNVYQITVRPPPPALLTNRNHLRPFLGRIPTASPDLFTPNPSLLHHLPQNGSSSHGLVAQTQSHTQASGSAGSTGRAGYQGGSAGSGGYSVSLFGFSSANNRAMPEHSHHSNIPRTHPLVFEMTTRNGNQRGGNQYRFDHLIIELLPSSKNLYP